MANKSFKRLLTLFLCVLTLISTVGCHSSENKYDGPSPIINNEYLSHLAGKTFQPKNNPGDTMLTFYAEGVATYDHSMHHYGYVVEVVETTDAHIKLHLKTTVIQSSDYIEREYTEATYSIADETIYYFQPYVCLYDPNNSEHYSNTYAPFGTLCSEDGCSLFIALSGHTKYCSEHANNCEDCSNYLDPGVTYCDGCPKCIDCEVKIEPGTGGRCSTCKKNSNSGGKRKEKCFLCNGTGRCLYYYGSSNLEAYLNGHDPYWYGHCGVCDGTGWQ